MKFGSYILAGLLLSIAPVRANADIIFSQPQSPTGGLIQSSWVSPDGTDADRYAWDSFTLSAPALITEVQWQGAGAPTDFTVRFHTNYTTPSDPNILAEYDIPGNAGQTPIGIVNGSQRYTYRYVLPTPLPLAAFTNYAINIEGWTSSVFTSWAISQGSGGNGLHVDHVVGLARFLSGPGDLAFTLIGSGPPQLSQQPVSQAACAGSNASFTVASPATGPLAYQWRRATVNLTDDGHITGSQTPNLQIFGVVSGDVAAYSCLVTNASGTTPSTSANLMISGSPVITLQPAARGGCIGATIVMNANATSLLPLTAQWRRNGVPIPGATQYPNYVFTVNANIAGSYDCVFSNSCGTSTTNAANVSVYSPMTIAQQPSPTTACVGDSASFTVAANSDIPATYAWRLNGLPIPYWVNPSSQLATLTITPVTAASYGTYDCVVTGSCTSQTSTTAILSPGAAPTIVAPPAPARVCSTGLATFSVIAAGSNSNTYQWQWQPADANGGTAWVNLVAGDNSDVGGTPVVNVTNINSTALEARPLAGYNTFAPRAFRCIVTNGCGSVNSTSATLTLCVADFNCDGGVDFFDYLDFVDAFSSQLPAADFNSDGIVDFFDYLDFADEFSIGC